MCLGLKLGIPSWGSQVDAFGPGLGVDHVESIFCRIRGLGFMFSSFGLRLRVSLVRPP